MKKVLLIAALICMIIPTSAFAEISKSYDQFSGTISVKSTKTAKLNDALSVKVIVEKNFFSDNAFKDIGASMITIQMQSTNSAIPSPILANVYYWIAPGEPFGHTENFEWAPASSVRISRMSLALKKAITAKTALTIKVPLLTGNDQVFQLNQDTIDEWHETITYDAINNPPK